MLYIHRWYVFKELSVCNPERWLNMTHSVIKLRE